MKVKEYVKLTSNPFINNTLIGMGDAVCEQVFQDNLKDYIEKNFGRRNILDSIIEDCETDEDLTLYIKEICSNLYLINHYKYQHLYDTTVAVYNPIENYRMTETENSEGGSTHSKTFSKQAHTDTVQESLSKNSYTDTTSNTFDKGTHTDTETDTNQYGAQKETTDNGANGAIVNTHSVAPFDSDTMHPESSDSNGVSAVNKIAYTDTLGKQTVVGSSQDTESGSNVYGARSETNSATNVYGAQSDTDSGTETNTNERELTRSGNIGVTTSQQMLQSERDLAMFSLYKIVAKDILNVISIKIYEV